MPRLFRRSARLTVWEPKPETFFADPNATNAVVIEQLRVSFTVERSIAKEPDTCEIEITNAAQETRALFQRKPLCARLEAGYNGELRTIFMGDVTHAVNRIDGTEWVTKVSVADGMRAFKNARISRSFDAGVTVASALQSIAGALQLRLPAAVASDPALRAQFASGLALQGSASEQLTRLLEPHGFAWTIQHGQLVVLRATETLAGAVVVNEASGLIGSPEAGTPSKDNKIPMITITTLFNDELLPGRRVALTSRDYNNALLKIVKTSLVGDTHGGDFTTTIEGLPL
jgi:hypothetical protein